MTLTLAAVFAAAVSLTPVPQSADAGHWWTKRLAEKKALLDAANAIGFKDVKAVWKKLLAIRAVVSE